MKKIKLSLLLIAFAITGYAQQNLSLTFTGVNNISYVQLDSIRIMNLTQNCDTVLHWPDTVLNLTYVGVSELKEAESRMLVFQNHPNPVVSETDISVYIPEKDDVKITVADITGKTILNQRHLLDKGTHKFLYKTGSSRMYLFTISGKHGTGSIKILSTGTSKNQPPVLTYSGTTNSHTSLKSTKTWRDFVFIPGDEIIIAGSYDNLESGIFDFPETSQDYIFQFAFDIPCPGMPTVTHGGQVYNTVQIFNQCWLKENLNIGEMIPGADEMEDNGAIEKYCYDDVHTNCDEYGGLYQWNEMMQYITQKGTQGICPDGWHIPTDEEWKILEGTVDSQYPVGDPEWDDTVWRGYDSGENLKSTSGWNSNRNGTDLYGFGGLPGGLHTNGGWPYYFLGIYGYWWSSSETSGLGAWDRILIYDNDGSHRDTNFKPHGLSVRCLKDN
jgi:uncharacterized protein (TIGR02145 family)